MSNYATPILYLNMGGEMMYVLQQRLKTQRISPDKTIQVMNDVISALLNPKQLQIIFDQGPLMGLTLQRAILERVVLSSIMKLDANSMDKLFSLMVMMVKYQLITCTGPREVVLSTLNHIDAIREMSIDKRLAEQLDLTHRLVVETYGKMTFKEIWQIRNECLVMLQELNVRVSILLKLGMQNQDTTFNRLIQRYDEKYMDRREVLENVKLMEYTDEEGCTGSLSVFGDRATSLGKNVYSLTFGRVHSSRSIPNLHQVIAASNKSARQELETLATQLGREETVSKRPFSLQLFAYNDDNDDDNKCMECDSAKTDVEDANTAAVEAEKDEEGNLKNSRNENESINEYRNNLIKNINSEFEMEEARTETMDLMNMLDVM